MTPTEILIVDDDAPIRRVLRTTLAAQGYIIQEAGSGEEALDRLHHSSPAIVLLDMNLPGIDGIETCRTIRRSWDMPVIMLTVRDSERDKVRALDAGADDYIGKPFGFPELQARIRAALRRSASGQDAASIHLPGLEVDFERRIVIAHGNPVHLAPKEFELLRVLAAEPGKPLSHRRLLQVVWGPEYGDEAEYLRVAINQLRKKIESDPGQPQFILTEPRVGYRFVGGNGN